MNLSCYNLLHRRLIMPRPNNTKKYQHNAKSGQRIHNKNEDPEEYDNESIGSKGSFGTKTSQSTTSQKSAITEKKEEMKDDKKIISKVLEHVEDTEDDTNQSDDEEIPIVNSKMTSPQINTEKPKSSKDMKSEIKINTHHEKDSEHKSDSKVVSNIVEAPKIKLTLTNLKVVATWRYNSENQDCKLCHKDLMLPVQEPGTSKINGDVTVGTCNHAFHTVCINSWLVKKNISCPYCSTSWKPASNVGSSVYVYKSTV